MNRHLFRLGCAAVAGAFCMAPSSAQSVVRDIDQPEATEQKIMIPYAFFSNGFGLGVGLGGGKSNFLQEQSSIFGALTLGTAKAYNASVIINNLRVPGTKRLFVSPLFVAGLYQNQRLYVGSNNPGYEGERAGSNESDPDNYFEESTWDLWSELRFSYVLPMGDGKEDPISHYVLDGQILADGASGGHSWNPFLSGKTFLKLTPAWRELTVDPDEVSIDLKTLNLRCELEIDNQDYPTNPSRGYNTYVRYEQDFKDTDNLGSWKNFEGEYTQYIPLPTGGKTRQQVLAFTAFSAYCPTWETKTVDGTEQLTNRPPYFEGPNLGGFFRMRAYDGYRFQDKASIYYSGEYRIIPDWQPIRDFKVMRLFGFDGWQFVFFGEMGRVAPSWNLSELHSHLKWDIGGSMRLFFSSAVGRLDYAAGEEGSQILVMYGHPF